MFFTKKKRNTEQEYEEAKRRVNNQNYYNQGNKKASDRIEFVQVIEASEIINLATKIKGGMPTVVNFEKMTTEVANLHLNFLSGVCFALEGKIIAINNKSYLFSKKENFLDGTLNDFVSQFIDR